MEISFKLNLICEALVIGTNDCNYSIYCRFGNFEHDSQRQPHWL